MAVDQQTQMDELGQYKFGWNMPENYAFKSKRGLNREIVEEISFMKSEPQWMRDFRLRSLRLFEKKPLPNWGGDLSQLDFQHGS